MSVVVVGGVGELYQGDLDLGRHAVERLAVERLGPHVLVEDLFYGAIAVSQRLAELGPAALVLVGATRWGALPGTVRRRRFLASDADPAQAQQAVVDAGTGYVGIDLIVEVARALGTLPAQAVAVEVEPAVVGPVDHLSPLAVGALDQALAFVRAEVDRAPLAGLVVELRETIVGDRLEPSAATRALEELLGELDRLADEGRWGRAFALRDRMRAAIATGGTAGGLEHRDWGLWWALIEELDRLEAAEARTS